MKLTTITLLTACFAATAGLYGQDVTLSVRNVPMEKIFRLIESQTDYVFFYDYNVLSRAKRVSIQCKDLSLEEALNLCFKDQPLTYSINSKTIIVKAKDNVSPINNSVRNENSLETIKGTIKDVEGGPIDNATISIEGTKKGTTTDLNGRFSINCKKGDRLIITSVGYEMKETTVDRTSMQILLNVEAKPLEQVIVGGNVVATKRKSEVSSVTIIDSKTLQKLPFQNIEQIFRGLVPGANNVQPTSFETFQGYYSSGSVTIRGSAGFGGLGIMKIIIDGVEFAGGSFNLNTIDKDNIERIEVVKGPGAATLYGTGAEGGVLLIFTKSQPVNTTDIQVTTSAGWQDSKWENKGKFQQVHSFAIMQGYNNISYTIGGNLNNSDSYMPGGKMNQHAVYGNLKYVKDNLKIILSGRHFINNFVPSRNAFFDTSSASFFNTPGFKLPDTTQGNISTDQLALNIGFRARKWWLHNVTLGWDGNEVTQESKIYYPPLRRYWTSNQSPTIRYNNSITIGTNSDFRTTLVMGMDYTNLLHKLALSISATRIAQQEDRQRNTGFFAQLNPSFKNRIYLTIGARYDINRNFKSSVNPKIGATTNFKTGPITWKPRLSWGKGITPPGSGQRYPAPSSTGSPYIANPELRPQNQTGWDYGLELYSSRNKWTAEIAHYNNILKDAFFTSLVAVSGAQRLQTVNAGKIQNKGWEFSAGYRLKDFTISANYAITNSILKEPIAGKVDPKDITYPGEQMPFIAKYTSGFLTGYQFSKVFGKSDPLSVTLMMNYTSGIRSIDNNKYIFDVAVYGNYANIIQYGTRYYMIDYASITKFNFDLNYRIIQPLDFFFQIRNIGNNTTGEYLNTQPAVGRGWLFGLRYYFHKAGAN